MVGRGQAGGRRSDVALGRPSAAGSRPPPAQAESGYSACRQKLHEGEARVQGGMGQPAHFPRHPAPGVHAPRDSSRPPPEGLGAAYTSPLIRSRRPVPGQAGLGPGCEPAVTPVHCEAVSPPPHRVGVWVPGGSL